MSFRLFDASNLPGSCRWCGRALRKSRDGKRLGDYGDGFFCGLRCGHDFAVRMSELKNKFSARRKDIVTRKQSPKKIFPKCPDCGETMVLAGDMPSFRAQQQLTCANQDCDQCDFWLNTDVDNTEKKIIYTLAVRK